MEEPVNNHRPFKDNDELMADLQHEIEAIKADNAANWQIFQRLMGVKFVRNGQEIGCMVLTPEQNNKTPGIISDIYYKIKKLWKKYGGEIIIAR